MGCGASVDPVSLAKRSEEIRLAPLRHRLEEMADLHRRGLMGDADYDKYRAELAAQIAGVPVADSTTPTTGRPSGPSVQKKARQSRADEFRKEVSDLEERMKSSPHQLPDEYFRLASMLPPKFTHEIQEQDEWKNAGSGPLQEYYNSSAGRSVEDLLSDRTIPLDTNRNPLGSQYDLPRDGTLQECTLVLMWFSKEGQYGNPVEALKRKGFHVVVHDARISSEQQMMISLLVADVVWLVSGAEVEQPGFTQLVDALAKFHFRGGGLFIWADNAPHFAHANILLERLLPSEGIFLEGNDHGSQIMHAHSIGTVPGKLTTGHLIMTGLRALFEGVTVSYLSRVGPLKVLATYNNGPGYGGKPYCAVADADVYRALRPPHVPGRGRIVIDGGFTKLYDDFWNKTAGTERYVKNASTWLLNMNSRILSEGDIAKRCAPTVSPTPGSPLARDGRRRYRA